jgi:hypothetical protein
VDTQAAPLGPSPLSVHRDAFTVALWVPLGLSPFYVHFDAQGFTVATRAASLGPLLVHRNAFMVVARTPLGRPPFSNGVHGLWVERRSFQRASSQPSKERRAGCIDVRRGLARVQPQPTRTRAKRPSMATHGQFTV